MSPVWFRGLQVSPGLLEYCLRRAYQFMVGQHAQFLSAGNTKLGPRYTLLRQYFETRLELWGLPAVA